MRARAFVRRVCPAAAVAAILAAALSGTAMRSDTPGPLRFAISFPSARSAKPIDGRVLLFISDDGRTEPRIQSDQYRANTTRPIFGVDIDGLTPAQDAVIDERVAGWPARSLKDIPAGEYCMCRRSSIATRPSTGPTATPSRCRWTTAKGSTGTRSRATSTASRRRCGSIRRAAARSASPWIRRFRRSAALGHGAGEVPAGAERAALDVLGPADGARRDRHAADGLGAASQRALSRADPSRTFPAQRRERHWRETPPDTSARGAQRDAQAAAYQFYKDWNGPGFPRMIHVLIQHPTPYSTTRTR